MGIKKKNILTNKTLNIKDKSTRIQEAIGFDDMVAITLGDNSKVLPSKGSRSGGIEATSFDVRIAEENKVKRKSLFILAIVAIISITMIIVVESIISYHQEQTDGKIRVNYSSENLIGSNYEDVIAQLKKQGFTNIKIEKEEDLITGWLTKDGEVESVSIDGITSFSSESRFLPDVEIILTYHTFSS